MPDKKLTDSEIVKALPKVRYGGHGCKNCKYDNGKGDDRCGLKGCKIARYALDLINRLQAENEELAYKLECLLCHSTGGKMSKHTYPLDVMERCVNDTIQEYCEEAMGETKAEAYKEFAERLKEKLVTHNCRYNGVVYDINAVNDKDIDNLLKELGGE